MPMPIHLLIVEDESNMVHLLQKTCERMGFKASVAINGVEAIDAMNKGKFDAILLDLLMPEKDGFQVLEERVQTMNVDTPIYVLTNLGQDDNIARAISLGAKECFVKSKTSPKEVLEKVKAGVGR